MARVPIGQMLKQAGVIDDRQVRSALEHQRKWGGRIGQALLSLRLVQEETLLAAIGRQLGVPVVRVADQKVSPAVLALVPEKLIWRHRVLPLAVISVRHADRLVVAFPTPDDLAVVDEVAFAAGMEVSPVLAGEDDLVRAISRHYGLFHHGAVELPPAPDEPMLLVDGRAFYSH